MDETRYGRNRDHVSPRVAERARIPLLVKYIILSARPLLCGMEAAVLCRCMLYVLKKLLKSLEFRSEHSPSQLRIVGMQ